ncbi:hypothetical protein IWQ62_002027 [Dispira parvispora]|uniref:Uncharacterized protein n=1 Tax=Dispira parvispora TaxID=1520584 RepID=A0A9W8AXN6_9FUNG|nr:hypothetical protein IWQ62_002027 [Dispira parvispora]
MMAPKDLVDQDQHLSEWVVTLGVLSGMALCTLVGLYVCFRRSNRLIPTGIYLLRQRLTQTMPEDDPQSQVRQGLLSQGEPATYSDEDDTLDLQDETLTQQPAPLRAVLT